MLLVGKMLYMCGSEGTHFVQSRFQRIGKQQRRSPLHFGPAGYLFAIPPQPISPIMNHIILTHQLVNFLVCGVTAAVSGDTIHHTPPLFVTTSSKSPTNDWPIDDKHHYHHDFEYKLPTNRHWPRRSAAASSVPIAERSAETQYHKPV